MVKLYRKMRGLLKQELELANKDNGDHFHSVHEAYGVIAEENNEAWDESIDVHTKLDDLLSAIRANNRDRVLDAAKDIERHATLAACEYVQVAAMARKLRDSERRK